MAVRSRSHDMDRRHVTRDPLRDIERTCSQSVSSRTDFHTHYWYLFYLTIATLYYRYLDARSRGFSFICETTIITFISQCGTFFCRKLKKWCWPQNKNISSKLKWQLRIYFYWGWHYNKYFSVLCLSLFHSLLLVLSLSDIHIFIYPCFSERNSSWWRRRSLSEVWDRWRHPRYQSLSLRHPPEESISYPVIN